MEKDKWTEWRSKGLGASDAPVVMGVSPYKTRLVLWEEKVGLAAPYEGNWATRRGNELEPKARAHYELIYNTPMPIAFVEHKDHPFIRASLDGYNEEKSIVLEIKCPGKDDHNTAKAGKVPDKYYPQVQHQLLATGAKLVHYYSFDGEGGTLVEVIPDLLYIERLKAELISFWDMVKEQVPPEISDKDFKSIEDAEVISDIAKWESIKKKTEALKIEEEEIREKITSRLASHNRWRHEKVSIYKVFKKGNIEYSKIPVLAQLDLEQFRKKGSSSWTFKGSKK